MKTKRSIVLLAVTVTVMFIYSCTGGSNTGKMLVKKWQVESIKSTDFDKEMAGLKQMSDTAKDSMTKAAINDKIKMEQSFMDVFKNTIVEYKADSSFEMTVSFMGQTQTNKGKWTLTQDEKKIIATDEKQKKDTTVIVELTQDKFSVSSPDKSVSIVYKAVKS